MIKEWIGSVDYCNICNTAIGFVFIDGRTLEENWAILCPQCHSNYGVGLGVGKGQKYKRVGGNWIKIEG